MFDTVDMATERHSAHKDSALKPPAAVTLSSLPPSDKGLISVPVRSIFLYRRRQPGVPDIYNLMMCIFLCSAPSHDHVYITPGRLYSVSFLLRIQWPRMKLRYKDRQEWQMWREIIEFAFYPHIGKELWVVESGIRQGGSPGPLHFNL